MPVSIDSCSRCKAPVLPDTVVCPACGEVLRDDDAKLYSEPQSEEVAVEAGAIGLVMAEMEDACPSCGSMVRSGLVKCWNCQAFMKKEVAELYEKQQTNPQKITYSETDREDYLPPRRVANNGEVTFQAGAGDFELNGATTESGGFDLSNVPERAAGFNLAPPVGLSWDSGTVYGKG